jgi:hypothetical protein
MDKKDDIAEFEKFEQRKFKLKFINQTLESLNKLIGKRRPFEMFNVDDLPTNSDVVLILAQYAASIYDFRRDHTVYESGRWYWVVRGNRSDLKTGPPQDFKYRRR